MRIALKEIIWEITGACYNNCKYCGSSSIRKTEVNEETILNIATKIAEFPPKELDISGGDPLLVPLDTHRDISYILPNVTRKILFNPKSFFASKTFTPQVKLEILAEYSYLGISVNTEEEIEHFLKIKPDILKLEKGYTVITNFNLTNYHLVDYLVSEVVQDQPWQIQFSILPTNALYEYPLAVDRLNRDLGKYPNLKLIVADNGNPGECGAGMSTLGILHDGTVVPCLAMRSWLNDEQLMKFSQGNILKEDLKHIWMTKFLMQRFGDENFECCKDICDRQLIKPVKAEEKLVQDICPNMHIIGNFPKTFPTDVKVTLYAVSPLPTNWPNFNLKPVQELDSVMAYAVQPYNAFPVYSVGSITSGQMGFTGQKGYEEHFNSTANTFAKPIEKLQVQITKENKENDNDTNAE